MKCDNCSNDAVYTHADPGVSPANYCVKCLPQWLHVRANAGHFPLVQPIKAETEKIIKKKPVVKSTAVPTEEATPSESN